MTDRRSCASCTIDGKARERPFGIELQHKILRPYNPLDGLDIEIRVFQNNLVQSVCRPLVEFAGPVEGVKQRPDFCLECVSVGDTRSVFRVIRSDPCLLIRRFRGRTRQWRARHRFDPRLKYGRAVDGEKVASAI